MASVGGIAGATLAIALSALLGQIAMAATVGYAGSQWAQADVARLAQVMAAAGVTAAIADLGAQTTIIRLFGETKSFPQLRWVLCVRLLSLLPIVMVAGIAACIDNGVIACGVALGSVNLMWMSYRASLQVTERYCEMMMASAAIAVARLAVGIAMVTYCHDAPTIVWSAMVATLPVAVLATPKFAALIARGAWRRPARRVGRYSIDLAVNGVAFVLPLYAPQYMLKLESQQATYGIAITFTAPMVLLSSALRNAILPKLVSAGSRVDEALWSRRGLLVIFGTALALILCCIAIAMLLPSRYTGKFPELRMVFMIVAVGQVATAAVGMLTMTAHTTNSTRASAVINIIRSALCGGVFLAADASLLLVASSFATFSIIGELWLAFIVRKRARE